MQTFSGGATTYQFGGRYRQILVNNTGGSSLNVRINGDTTGFDIEASGKRGWRINKGIYEVILSGTHQISMA